MFDIRAKQSTVVRELLGGLTTFMAMSYIIFVQPAVLSTAGMDRNGVMIATCIAAAIGSIAMGLMANYPIALAPGMGENFFFVYSMVGVGSVAFGLSWQAALALTTVAGALFLLLSLVGFRSKVMHTIPNTLKSGITAGIGLFIALIGLRYANIVVTGAGTPVALADLRNNPCAWLALIGLGATLMLMAFRIRGAILLGILVTMVAAFGFQRAGIELKGFAFQRVVAVPTGWTTTAGHFVYGYGELWRGLVGGHWADVLTLLFMLLFMDLFDTVGTLVGVAHRAGLMPAGRLPRAERALAADAGATVAGAMLGTSTVTSYIESVTGVNEGARTGLAAVTVGVCMLAALFFQPLVALIGGGIQVGVDASGNAVNAYPMISAALVVVGAMMMRAVREINWDDATEFIPGFLTVIGMAFTYSIAHGIALGFVSYATGKILTGRFRQCSALVYVLAALFVLRYALMPV